MGTGTPPSFFEGFSPPVFSDSNFSSSAALHCTASRRCRVYPAGRPPKPGPLFFPSSAFLFHSSAVGRFFWAGFLFSFTWLLIIQRRRLRGRMDLQKTGDETGRGYLHGTGAAHTRVPPRTAVFGNEGARDHRWKHYTTVVCCNCT